MEHTVNPKGDGKVIKIMKKLTIFKNIAIILVIMMSLLLNIISIRSCRKLSEEIRVLRLFYNVHEDVLNEHFVESQVDSIYLNYGVYYQHKYYNENFK